MGDSKTIISLLRDLLGERAIRVGTLYHGRGMPVRRIAEKLNITREAVKRDLRALESARITLSARQASCRDDRMALAASLN